MNDTYDVIIVGAGIGGLVCGCYLAKSGAKVLILEQHFKCGGYCTSFSRKGYTFDVGPHSLGSLRDGGILNKLLRHFDMNGKITFVSGDPTERVIVLQKSIFIRRARKDTQKELILNFPQQKSNIINFFKFLDKDFLTIVSATKNKSLQHLLDSFFSDLGIKSFLAGLILGNLGLPPLKASALISVILYNEFAFDGGYYPKGGMQAFADAFAARFREYGGTIILSKRVTEILTQNKQAVGVGLEDGEELRAEFVVSNADASLTFKSLMHEKCRETTVIKRLKESPSNFMIYLGVNKKLDTTPPHIATWHIASYPRTSASICDVNSFLIAHPSSLDASLCKPGKSVVRIFAKASYGNKKYWDVNKEYLYEKALRNVNSIFPGLNDSVVEVKELATPYTFRRYTMNKNGAAFGWAAIPGQIDPNVFPSKSSIKNLYLTGHWVTNGIGQSGVTTVALSGLNAAKSILRAKGDCYGH